MDSNYIASLNWFPYLINENKSVGKLLKDKNFEDKIIEISKYNLQKKSIDKIIVKLTKEKLKKFKKKKILFITNLTLEFFYERLKFSFLKYGIFLEKYEIKFDNFNKVNDLKINEEFDFIFVYLDCRKFITTEEIRLNLSKSALIKNKVNQFYSYLLKVKKQYKSHLIVSNFNLSEVNTLGNYNDLVPFSLNGVIKTINQQLFELSSKSRLFKIFDLHSISNLIGSINFFNNTLYNISKINYDLKYNNYMSERFSSLCASLIGKEKKVIVLDLDNTLWGGILGDDGYNGINLDINDPIAEGFLNFQKIILNYKESGIILAVSSKNFEENVKNVFDKNSKMILKKKDISVFKCNWENKAKSIQEISNILNLNLDSFIFLDDNPMERNLVRKFLPTVTVPELPEDPVNFTKFISIASYFNKDTITNEDRKRTDDYISNFKRVESKVTYNDYNKYLKSLGMIATFRIFEKNNLDRIFQLIMRSNQFNLTTKRYNEKKILDFISHKNYFPIMVELKDNFGDNGIISLIILNFNKKYCEIDTWIMSCRVLERGLEKAIMKIILDVCKKKSIQKIVGKYIQTEKNDLVKYHYDKLNFKKIEQNKSDYITYELILKNIQQKSYNSEIKILNKLFRTSS